MEKTQEFTAVLTGADRLLNTGDGNPRWAIATLAGTFRSNPDSQIGHEVGGRSNPDSPDSWIGRRVKFTASMAGTIIRWELAE